MIYLAGPMTGYPNYNVREFEAAAKRMRSAGYEVVTPFELNSQVWQRHHGRDFDPYTDKCDYGDPILAEMLELDMSAVARCSTIAVLPGWERSKGAKAEVLVALNLNKVVVDAWTFREIPVRATVALEFL